MTSPLPNPKPYVKPKPVPKSAPKSKPKTSSQGSFSLIDVIMPRKPSTRYGTELSPETVANALKTLDNHTSRNVVIAKKPTPQGVRYSFRIEFREKKTIRERHGRRTVERQEWQTQKQIDGTVMPGKEGEFPTIIEFTPERLTSSLIVILGFFILVGVTLAAEIPQNMRALILFVLVVMAAILFLSPYLYVTYGPQNTMLEQRMVDVMDKLGATKLDDASDTSPKPKKRAPVNPKTQA